VSVAALDGVGRSPDQQFEVPQPVRCCRMRSFIARTALDNAAPPGLAQFTVVHGPATCTGAGSGVAQLEPPLHGEAVWVLSSSGLPHWGLWHACCTPLSSRSPLASCRIGPLLPGLASRCFRQRRRRWCCRRTRCGTLGMVASAKASDARTTSFFMECPSLWGSAFVELAGFRQITTTRQSLPLDIRTFGAEDVAPH
jgi:hypothetical protein